MGDARILKKIKNETYLHVGGGTWSFVPAFPSRYRSPGELG